jgi:phosphoglycerol transferase MdoB-like AlkP superfamily enzyme
VAAQMSVVTAFGLLVVVVWLLELVTGHGPLQPFVRAPSPSLTLPHTPSLTITLPFIIRTGTLWAAFSLLIMLTGRPWHAAFVTLAIAASVIIVSVIKRRILAEPLVFTDLALIKQAWLYPRLYYLDVLYKPWAWALIALVAALLTATTLLWFSVEPDAVPWAARIAALVVFLKIMATAFWRPMGRVAARHLAVDGEFNVRALGLTTSLVMTALARHAVIRPSDEAIQSAKSLPRLSSATGPRLIIGLQLESFVDLAARGIHRGPELPGVRAMRAQSVYQGPLRVPAEGAYTMRTEAAVLTGLSPQEFGLDATDPYLNLDRYHLPTLPSRLREGGYRTLFMHPHEKSFFRRDCVIPALGFDSFIGAEAFGQAERFGPYVTDLALAEEILKQAANSPEPLFICAITLENHGPWSQGRIADIPNPAEQYFAHLTGTDRMIARLHTALQDYPGGAIIMAWGDHVPARTLDLDVGERLSTDYWLWDSRMIHSGTPPLPKAAHELTRLILRQL